MTNSSPALLRVGGNLTIRGNNTTNTNSTNSTLTNKDSQIIVGGNINLTDIALSNQETKGNKRCKTNPDGSLKINAEGLVEFRPEVAKVGSLDEFLTTPDGIKMAGLTGGIQGSKGTLFGVPYQAGSWQDQLVETFAGTHDMVGGKLSGLYDEQGNIRREMSNTTRKVYDYIVTPSALVPSTPFAAAELLSPEMWNAISILLKGAR